MFTCDEVTTEIEQVLQKKAADVCLPLPLKAESLDGKTFPKTESVPQHLPLEGTDRESRAAELLNLIGCRMWREEEIVVIGYWPCFDGPELRRALSMVEGPVAIRALSDPDVPAVYRMRHVPEKAPEQSLADWITRRRAAMNTVLSGHDDTDRQVVCSQQIGVMSVILQGR